MDEEELENGQWRCKGCGRVNSPDDLVCNVCMTCKPGTSPLERKKDAEELAAHREHTTIVAGCRLCEVRGDAEPLVELKDDVPIGEDPEPEAKRELSELFERKIKPTKTTLDTLLNMHDDPDIQRALAPVNEALGFNKREIKKGHEIDTPEALAREDERRQREGLMSIAQLEERRRASQAIEADDELAPDGSIIDHNVHHEGQHVSPSPIPGLDDLNERIEAALAADTGERAAWETDPSTGTVHNEGDVAKENRWAPEDGFQFDPDADEEVLLPGLLKSYRTDATTDIGKSQADRHEEFYRGIWEWMLRDNGYTTPTTSTNSRENRIPVSTVLKEALRLTEGGYSHGGPLEERARKLLDSLSVPTNAGENRPSISELRSRLAMLVKMDVYDVLDIRNCALGVLLGAALVRRLSR